MAKRALPSTFHESPKKKAAKDPEPVAAKGTKGTKGKPTPGKEKTPKVPKQVDDPDSVWKDGRRVDEDKIETAKVQNAGIIDCLRRYGSLVGKGTDQIMADQFKARAYGVACNNVKKCGLKLDSGKMALGIKKIGKSIGINDLTRADKIDQVIATGTIAGLDSKHDEESKSPKNAHDDAEDSIPKNETTFQSINSLIPEDEMIEWKDKIFAEFAKVSGLIFAFVGPASYKAETDKIEFLVCDSIKVAVFVESLESKFEVIQEGSTSEMVKIILKSLADSKVRRLEIKMVPKNSFVTRLLFMTSSPEFLKIMCESAVESGFHLDADALKNSKGDVVLVETERQIFELIHFDFVDAEDRNWL